MTERVLYGKSCQVYFEAMKKGDEAEIYQAYQRLMAEIRAADSLEMVEAMQRMYHYLMQQLTVTPIPSAVVIVREIRKRLEELKTEKLEEIELKTFLEKGKKGLRSYSAKNLNISVLKRQYLT